MKTQKWFKKEARIITELFRDKLPDGIKADAGLSDDGWGGLVHQVHEQGSKINKIRRTNFIYYISKKYNLALSIDSKKITIDDRKITFLEYYPSKFAGTQTLLDLTDMDGSYFRAKIGSILAAVPGGIKHFETLAEETPYIFN